MNASFIRPSPPPALQMEMDQAVLPDSRRKSAGKPTFWLVRVTPCMHCSDSTFTSYSKLVPEITTELSRCVTSGVATSAVATSGGIKVISIALMMSVRQELLIQLDYSGHNVGFRLHAGCCSVPSRPQKKQPVKKRVSKALGDLSTLEDVLKTMTSDKRKHDPKAAKPDKPGLGGTGSSLSRMKIT